MYFYVFLCISLYFFVYEIASSFSSLIPRNDTKPNSTLFGLIHFVYLIFKGAKRNFSSFKTTILNNNLKGKEEVLNPG